MGHGGNLRALSERSRRSAKEILDFSANVNPLGPPQCLRPVISRFLDTIVHYPDPESADLIQAIVHRYGLDTEEVFVGNGTSELLFAVARILHVPRAIIPVPSYLDYVTACQRAGIEVQALELSEEEEFRLNWARLARSLKGREAVFLGQPNNPTGFLLDAKEFQEFACAHSDTVFVLDEAFLDFTEEQPSLCTPVLPNVIGLHSLTKFYAIPGLRLGFGVAPSWRAGIIRKEIPPWSVNALAQAVGVAVLSDGDYRDRTLAYVTSQRKALMAGLSDIKGIHVYPGTANFLLCRLDRQDCDAWALQEKILEQGLAIRVFGAEESLDRRFFRIAVRTQEEDQKILEALSGILSPETRPKTHPLKKAATLMFQGTSSNAGKSVLTAGLCRLLLQEGIRVAPFKAQNMSLNSFVTSHGGEMGRAQVVQAQACRLEPDVRMNPILLKPNSDTGSQVIVQGQFVGNMKVMEYVRYKPQAFEKVRACFDSLSSEFDALVLEGAGSPGEVNLKGHDIVNMRMALYAKSPVLIVGDIDRGGVYASFVGTMEVLDAWERALVAGWVVNRFRGDPSLLAPAHDYTLAHTGRPVLGVVPYLKDLGLPEEDSVSFKAGDLEDRMQRSDAVTVAVIDLPHISNFTDFDALRIEKDVVLRVIRSRADLDSPDAIILPGSKNVINDLKYLRESGLADAILSLAREERSEILGICGGLQILGRTIRDPLAIESQEGAVEGLGLLNTNTVLAREKTLKRVKGIHTLSGTPIVGYEIHHGVTEMMGLKAILAREDGETVGIANEDHRIWATYLHGVFDSDLFRRWFVDRLRVRKGLGPLSEAGARYEIDTRLDRLADVLRTGLDMPRIFQIMGLR